MITLTQYESEGKAMDQVEKAQEYLSRRYGIKTKAELVKAVETMEKIDIGLFVDARKD